MGEEGLSGYWLRTLGGNRFWRAASWWIEGRLARLTSEEDSALGDWKVNYSKGAPVLAVAAIEQPKG